ncbi:HDIG domain-containing metalloprotein [Velocimicrobium porci]|uniref:HDIG domain-containing protein n=1 Tax=Velocimicrobium porci TaxID=2606634 RepID=A0A6L5XYU1_9FIRM|nr:HDIG domain-containing metalloprotein [Velocimicrobium porci]MSS64020.1 HDIG domain-containing protein [Velocimicrobium porci]
MKEKKMLFRKKKETLIGVILLLATILGGFVANNLFPQKANSLRKSFAMTILMVLIVWFGIDIDEFRLIDEKQKQQLFVASYFLSLCFSIASGAVPVYNLWMVGGAWIAAYLNLYLGLAIQFIFTYFVCSLNRYTIEEFLFYFILGAVICLLGKYCDKRITFIYVTIITVSCNIILLFVANNFVFHDSMNTNTFYSVGTTVLVTVSIFLGFRYGTKYMEWEESKIGLEKMDGDMLGNARSSTEDIYPKILSEDFELLKQLRERSTVLYGHSLKIAELSSGAARLIGCNQEVARAGGLYHEIGKLKGKDYVEEGVLLTKEYHFPKEVVDVIKQHNSKIEKPKSKEAAVVMLAESVVSTIHYFEYEKKKASKEGRELKEQPVNKIVSNIMDIRFTKGALDESGISISEFNKLKQYFIESLF